MLARRRVDLYFDDCEGILNEEIGRVFDAPEVRERIYPFVRMASANNLLKRVADEIGRPVYSTTPVRRVDSDEGQIVFAALAREMDLDRQMDLATRLLVACNDVILFPRYVQGHGLRLDILTPPLVTIVPDPDVPAEPVAVAYEVERRTVMGREKRHVVWDAEQYFEINSAGVIVAGPVAHDLGRIPFVAVHRRARGYGEFWDRTSGSDLEAATIQTCLINALLLKLQKYQSHIQLIATSETGKIQPQGQTLDESNVLWFESANVSPVNLQASPEHFLRVKEHVESTVAANYGISWDRLQHKPGAIEVGLRERTAEIVAVMRRAEEDLFEVVKVVSREHPGGALPADARFAIDYGELHHRVDRKTQLEIRKEERSMGLRSIVDDVLEDNPELATVDEAWREVDANMAAEALFVLRRRALNIPADATVDEPGQSARENGALGPAVRDGRMSRDDAAEQARTGSGDDPPATP